MNFFEYLQAFAIVAVFFWANYHIIFLIKLLCMTFLTIHPVVEEGVLIWLEIRAIFYEELMLLEEGIGQLEETRVD